MFPPAMNLIVKLLTLIVYIDKPKKFKEFVGKLNVLC
jgi:hypothetical protein